MQRPSRAPDQSRSIPSLDGLRAISIALVLADHGAQLPAYTAALTPWIPLGTFGVHVFFVISGYLITTLLLREREKTGTISLGGFYLRRFLRIFPAFYVYLAVIAALGFAGAVRVPLEARMWPALGYLSNLVPTHNWLTGQSWSLAVEEQFYLTWPLALALLGRRRGIRVAAAMVLLAPVLRVALFLVTHNGHQAEDAIGYDFIAWGCLLALLRPALATRAEWQWLMRSRWTGPLLFLDALLARLVFGPTAGWMWAADIVVEQTIEGAMLVVVVAWAIENPESAPGRVLNAAPVRWVGVLSYSLYLWQQVFLRPDGWFAHWGAFVAAFAAAAASYYLVEKPALRLRGRLEAWWLARHPVLPADEQPQTATPIPA